MNQVIVIDDLWLSILLGSVIPLVTDVATKRFTTGWPKTVALVGLSAGTAVIQDVHDHGDSFTWSTLTASFFLALTTAFTTHSTVWKPLAVTGDNGVIQKSTAGVGLGGPRKPADVPVGGAVQPPPPGTTYGGPPHA